MSIEDFLKGRKLLKKEIPNKYHSSLKKNKTILKEKTMIIEKEKICCLRCNTTHLKKNCLISNKYETFYYCSECIGLGRVESKNYFYTVPDNHTEKRKIDFKWKGELTKDQKKISKNLVNYYKQEENHLIHAVTGAGKTEMLFELLKVALKKGHRVAVASPRVDVCLELHPRFQAVFPEESIALLYGKSKEQYRYTHFVVTTTHQLLRFREAFDLIVVDEVDAFPYADNPVLEFGTQQALKTTGKLVYLTATPSEKLMEKIVNKELKYSQLAKRYHGYQLPVPTCHFDYFLANRLKKGKLPAFLINILKNQRRQCLLFFPNIERMKQCFQLLESLFPDKRIAYVYANENLREEKIKRMRRKEIDWLLTTTILERGVTFPNVDVIIYEAHHRVFTQASLVQISGRVGRKKEFPTGDIYFLHSGKTKEINQAIKQIKMMNERAGFN
ncbi:DEAD/DEAH box helicase [Vagococcus carniphilus]|uniref:DEAD/DEAH box helicase n=1 Tax=Vagococcus carniphilus TaxID=218144 RepID=UPI00288FE1C9|nr:DEAD/DEAH box helicase [Vagococcus carniphilus]MDT2848554.1 DEAD/DEAH box helicase [Vagococcus carniphilus]